MAVIRAGEDGYNAYIFIDAGKRNHINISTPSYNGCVELKEANKVLNLLIKLEEVPPDIIERLFVEVQDTLTLKTKVF